eukprot:TRINITY_DN13469_c0_g1_i1.p1 TRINITY_DN13469_c0_g1~~TRINITY_DN13469_c0_g1_i1.p1  ORF type:complete len:470 (+),score=82.49 TRINITY_DN13469_c0_g1_i1:48-1412(+)
MSRTGVVWDNRVNGHRNLGGDHPENPSRTRSIVGHLSDCGVMSCCERVPAREATDEELLLVHTQDHLDTVKKLAEGQNISHIVCDDDVFSCCKTESAARTSIGGLIELSKKVVNGDLQNGFACIRPPGHHSNPQVPSGFCIFSNVAVAARAIQKEMPDKVKKVLIFDWDVHHGNGTEWVFYNDPSVLTVSVHGHGMGPTHAVSPSVKLAAAEEDDDSEAHVQSVADKTEDSTSDIKRRKVHSPSPDPEDLEAMDFFNNLGYVCDKESTSSSRPATPQKITENTTKTLGVCNDVGPDLFYPGTGFGERTGTGEAVGYNINIPWPCDGFGDLEYLRVVDEIVVPVGKEFKPDLVIVSAGFDSALGDTLGSMRVTPSGFDKMTEAMATLADGRLVLALEGGYNTEVISLCAESSVRALLRLSKSPQPASSLCHSDQCTSTIDKVKATHKDNWKCFQE